MTVGTNIGSLGRTGLLGSWGLLRRDLLRSVQFRVYAGQSMLRRSDGVCGGESACTPDSVRALARPGRPSLSAGSCLPAPAAYQGVSASGPLSPYLALLRVGFAEPPGSPRALVRSYRTVSP